MNPKNLDLGDLLQTLHHPLWLPKNTEEKLSALQSNCLDHPHLETQKQEFLKVFKQTQKTAASIRRRAYPRKSLQNGHLEAFLPTLFFPTAQEGETPYGEIGGTQYPDFREPHCITNALSPEKILGVLDYWWPKCPTTGKRMRYLGYIFLDFLIPILNAATCWRSHNSKISLLPVANYNEKDPYRIDFFVGAEEDFGWNRTSYSLLSSCEYHPRYQHRDQQITNNFISPEEYQDHLTKFLTQNEIVPGGETPLPITKLGAPTLQVEYEIFHPETNASIYLGPNNFPRKWTAKVFGTPIGQRTPKCPLCPNRLPRPRALCPTLGFHHPTEDVTYQIYQDLPDTSPTAYGTFEGTTC